MNPLIEKAILIHQLEWHSQKQRLSEAPAVKLSEFLIVESFPHLKSTDLMALSRQRTLALRPEETDVIISYYADEAIQKQRNDLGIKSPPTDVELEMLAQTWSEHCKHKIFNAVVQYTDSTTGTTQTIRSLYKTYVQASTQKIRQRLGSNDWCISVFSDNAGMIRFNSDWNITVKVETHNSPSALDPYGGALTGIVGVNRDSFGTGMGAQLLFNTDVFCFASPFYEGTVPPNLMHPRRIYEGVRLGVEHGGNKSGIPTINGSVVFHERFLGKPLVFCGSGGLIPASIHGQSSSKKSVLPGDFIVMSGGRIGKDGIHGATFSSEALHEGSPATAVQIGDPIVQKRLFDFLLIARDQGLYRCITDNGAGGLSSSVGEMAEFSGGCHLELEKALLKYPGLQPWEILVSESQERMTLAVPTETLDAFLQLSQEMSVESTALGTFNNSGFFHASYQGRSVAFLSMAFLHQGTPTLQLNANWEPPFLSEPHFPLPPSLSQVLKDLLGRLNICSKESLIRQYDHEVQGGSVIKPLVGEAQDGPGDSAVIRPLLDSMEGLVVGNGICPRYSDLDTYHMAACAIDEAIRNVIAVGGSLKQIAGLDNFCWCDPVTSEKNPDGSYKMAQLVRANQALYDYTTLFGVPCISGKDSMKNDYHHGSTRISIPPTLLFTTVGKIEDVRKVITMDFKQPNDLIYLLGETKDELGGSEYYDYLGFLGKNVPHVDGISAKKRYETVTQLIETGKIRSCHDCADGGMAVALAESAFAGGFGVDVDLSQILNHSKLRIDGFLFSESQSRFVVSVHPSQQQAFEMAFAQQPCFYLGRVTLSPQWILRTHEQIHIDERCDVLKAAWQKPLSASFE